MLRLPASVVYQDGTTDEITITQYAVSRWAMHCAQRGISYDAEKPGVMAVAQLRFMAWAELFRTSNAPSSYEAWDKTVDSVESEESGSAEPDPTQLAVSDTA